MPRRKDPRLRLVRTAIGYDRETAKGGRCRRRKGGWKTRDGRFSLWWTRSSYGWLGAYDRGALELTDTTGKASSGPSVTYHYGMREALAEIARRYDLEGLHVTVRGSYDSALKAARESGKAPESVRSGVLPVGRPKRSKGSTGSGGGGGSDDGR
jgi:hypothetical protein